MAEYFHEHFTPCSPISLSTNRYLEEVSAFIDQLQTFNTFANELALLQDAALRPVKGASEHLETATSNCSAQITMLKNSLKGLDWDVLLTEREGEDDGDAIDTKRTQYNMADRALTAALQKYNKSEKDHNTRSRELFARQYRSVYPDATPVDIEAGFQKNESEQVFSEAGNHLSIVKSSNLNQLADGFKIQIFEVDSMQAIKDINDLEKGNDNLKKETENTARNKKIMCISVTGALVIALLIFIPITVLVVLELQK